MIAFILIIYLVYTQSPQWFHINISSYLWLTVLNSTMLNLLTPLSLVFVGYLVERKYVGRISLFSNALAINLHFYLIHTTNPYLITYGDCAFAFGLIAIISYVYWWLTIEEYEDFWGNVVTENSDSYIPLPTMYYKTAYLFSSVVVGLLILFT